jgi:hypothetical protein
MSNTVRAIVSDEEWARALSCAQACLPGVARTDLDNAMQHAFGILALAMEGETVGPLNYALGYDDGLRAQQPAKVPSRDGIIEALRNVPINIEGAMIYAGKAIGEVPATILDRESAERIADAVLAAGVLELRGIVTAMHNAFMAMCAQRDNPDAEVFQDAIDALGLACNPDRVSNSPR